MKECKPFRCMPFSPLPALRFSTQEFIEAEVGVFFSDGASHCMLGRYSASESRCDHATGRPHTHKHTGALCAVVHVCHTCDDDHQVPTTYPLVLQMGLFDKQCREVNMVITTAMIPGKPAPKLITKEMVDKMKPGEGGRQTIMEQSTVCHFFCLVQ